MKRAVSVSLGSKTRDKAVEVNLLGEQIRIERIGVDGDEALARKTFSELDGVADAFGVGGIDLYIYTPWKNYPLHAAHKLITGVSKTPVVDGGGLRETLEARILSHVEAEIGAAIRDKSVYLVNGISRYGMTMSFVDRGYNCTFGDLMTGLDIPIPLHSIGAVNRAAKLLMPIAGRLPLSILYPTGEKQEEIVPKYERHYQENAIVAGDWLYIKRNMPDDLSGKVIVTNTITPEDVELLRQRGVAYLVTGTMSLDGRTFGTNMMEAALIALSGKGRELTHAELDALLDELGFVPEIVKLN